MERLHLLNVSSSAGYNHLDVVEFLLEQGADVNAKDKGGLIPLHNASSFGVGLSKPCICAYLHLSNVFSDCSMLMWQPC